MTRSFWFKRIKYFLVLIALMMVSGWMFSSNAGDLLDAKEMQPRTVYSNSVLLKDKEIRFSFAYPSTWHLIREADGYIVTVQNVSQFNNPAELGDGLPEGFVKVGFMVDPKAKPRDIFSQGEQISINGQTWQRRITTAESFGDYEVQLETVVEGVVLRIYGYVALTRGNPLLQERQIFEVEQIANSIRIEPVIFLDSPPGVPTFPPDGKPQATPIGQPRVP
ncbi:MAG: hypothetical protein WHS87_10495 [Anaerolineales bacterium]